MSQTKRKIYHNFFAAFMLMSESFCKLIQVLSFFCMLYMCFLSKENLEFQNSVNPVTFGLVRIFSFYRNWRFQLWELSLLDLYTIIPSHFPFILLYAINSLLHFTSVSIQKPSKQSKKLSQKAAFIINIHFTIQKNL